MEAVAGAVVGVLMGIALVMLLRQGASIARLRRDVALIARHLNVDLDQTPVLSDRVKELARDPRRKIEAIKQLRDETGAGLAEAKQLVEGYIRSLDT